MNSDGREDEGLRRLRRLIRLPDIVEVKALPSGSTEVELRQLRGFRGSRLLLGQSRRKSVDLSLAT
jgi:hypothetical protein